MIDEMLTEERARDLEIWLDGPIRAEQNSRWEAMFRAVQSGLRTLRRERAQLAARVEELEAENARLNAALQGRLHDEGPEAA